MVRIDPQFDPLKNKLDQVTIPPERRDKDNEPSPIYHHIGRIWKISHAQSQDADAQNNQYSSLLLHRIVDWNNFFTSFCSKRNFFS